MFAARCPHCHRTTLLSLDELAAIHQTEDGLELRYRCPEGHEATWRPRRGRARH